MQINKLIQYIGVSSFLLFLPFFVGASNLGIAVDQTAIVFDTDTDETQAFVVNVTNVSDESQEIEVTAMDYILGDDNEMTLTNENDEQNGVKDWVVIPQEKISLEKGEKKEVLFQVNTPENASIGSHRGAVVFRIDQKNNDSVKVNGEVGVHVLMNVKGDTHASGKINSFDVPLMAIGGPIEYSAEFENTGNIHYVPYGDVTVQNVFTKKENIYKYDKHFVFPGKTFNFILTEEIPSIFGLYKVRVAFVDGEGATRTKTDFTMGYLFPLVFILVIVLIVAGFRLIGKKDKSVKSKKTKKKVKKEKNNSLLKLKTFGKKDNVKKETTKDADEKDENDDNSDNEENVVKKKSESKEKTEENNNVDAESEKLVEKTEEINDEVDTNDIEAKVEVNAEIEIKQEDDLVEEKIENKDEEKSEDEESQKIKISIK